MLLQYATVCRDTHLGCGLQLYCIGCSSLCPSLYLVELFALAVVLTSYLSSWPIYNMYILGLIQLIPRPGI